MAGHRFRLSLTGEFNVRNAAMAVAVALNYGLSVEVLQRALATLHRDRPSAGTPG